MFKINNYLFKTILKYILLNQIIILFLVFFINLIELSKIIESQNKNIFSFFYLSFLKAPSIINETSPFVIIVSTAFMFRYLISNNELISMRNVGFSIFDIFKPITLGIFFYGIIILLILNPIVALSEIKYDEYLDNKNDNLYSINFSKNSLWIKNRSTDEKLYYINIEQFDVKRMYAENIKILSVENKTNSFFQAKNGEITKKQFILNDVNYFNMENDEYIFKKKLNLKLNFTKENLLSSFINYKNIPYYNYINHIQTLKKFNIFSSAITLHYVSELLKPFFMILLAFVVMSYSAKYKRNEKFF